ncbi:derl2 Probable derlin-2 [Candida maltosa Xu316]
MNALWTDLPPITKGWCVGIAGTAALVSMKRVKVMNLYFLPDKAFSKEYWRLITAFFASDELSVELFMELYFISRSCGDVEGSFTTNTAVLPDRIIDEFTPEQHQILHKIIERNKSLDFLYFIFQICISMIIAVTILHYKLAVTILPLGAVLCRTLVYIDAQNTPNDQINFMGVFSLKKSYYPWLEALITILMMGNIHEDVLKLRNNNYVVFRNAYVWFYVIAISVGHFWWSIRQLLLSKVHYDHNDRRRVLKRNVLKQHGIVKFDIVREVLIWILLPPWYWIIIHKIKQTGN